MLGLLGASVWCWSIIFDKSILYTRSRNAMNRFEQTFWSGQSLEELYRSLVERQSSGMAALFVAAMREWKRSLESPGRSFLSKFHSLLFTYTTYERRNPTSRTLRRRYPPAGL